MRSQDFLHKDADTKLCEHYIAAGARCRLLTNSEHVLEAARQTFLPASSQASSIAFSMRFWVDGENRSQAPWPRPYVRGLDHLVFAGFDERSSVLVDLRTRRVIGRFSADLAADRGYWRTVIFPMLLSVLAGSVGLIELHGACVAIGQKGLILAGPSRSGKSTLALALTAASFRFLSDDRTFCSLVQGKLLAWGLPRPLKLRREAAPWFDNLRDQEPTAVQNGETVFHFDPPSKRVSNCEPRVLVFLDRHENGSFEITQIETKEARLRIEKDLLAESPEAIRKQSKPFEELLSLPCWILRYGESPQQVAEQLAATFLHNSECPI
jgi:hypothetical protein